MERASPALPRSRIERLQELTAALSRAPAVEDVTDVVVTTITEDLGAGAAMIALLVGDDAATFEVVRAVGYLPATLELWRTFPMDASLPAGDALQQGRIVTLDSLADRDRRYPALRGMPAAHPAWAIAPLMVDGRPLGILSFGFACERSLAGEDRSFVQAVADQCAQALHRAQLYDDQRVMARERGFLNRAGAAFAEAASSGDLLGLVASFATPELADGAAVHVGVPGGLRPVATADAGPAARAVLAGISGGRAFTSHPLLEEVYRTAVPRAEPVGDLSRGPRSQERGPGQGSLLLVLPLQARGSTIGVLALVACHGRPLPPGSWSLAESYASLAALHCENARLLEEQTRIAQRLQSSLLPPVLPQIPGVELAATYAAAGSGAEVGGDFYDIFEAGPGRWIAVTGDVRGRGVDAAATTGLARHTVRAAAAPGAAPSAVARRLNEVLLAEGTTDDEPRFCAVCIVALTPTADGGHVTICCSGHPLPWLVRLDGSVREVGVPGSVAGVVSDPDLTDVTMSLQPGDTLLAFTDGIPERHSRGEFFEDGLDEVLAGLAHLDPRAMAERLLDQAAAFAAGEPDDDMAVLVLRMTAGLRPLDAPPVRPAGPTADTAVERGS